MVPISSNKDSLSVKEQRILLEHAYAAVAYASKTGRILPTNQCDFSDTLQQPGASFVTLKIEDKLRGCTGSIEAYRPLILDVASNAHSSARHDSRFKPLSAGELSNLAVTVSVLSPRTSVAHNNESDLLRQLRPGIDGLTIELGPHRALFLPIMWQQLPDPKEFLMHLKIKANLPPDYWSNDIQATSFQALLISDS